MLINELNDLIFFNNLIYKIYSVDDLGDMRRGFLEQLRLTLDFDASDFYLADKNNSTGLAEPIFYNYSGTGAGEYDELDYSRGILYSGKCIVYRESDIISEDARVRTDYYKKVYEKNGWHYAVQMILARNKRFLGVITFYRNKGKPDFSNDEVMMLDMLKDHMAFRLYRELTPHDKRPVRDIAEFAELHSLTKREVTVLELVMEGLSNQEISDRLIISVHTLKKHILNIYRKAGVNNRIQLRNKVAGLKNDDFEY